MYERYVAARDEKGMNDNQVAEKAKVGRSTFSDWKSGRSTPKLEKLMKIAKALDKPIEYFVGF